MYFLFTHRVAREGRLSVKSWEVSGPFKKSSLAERAMLQAMGVYTCLSAQVLTDTEVADLSMDGSETDLALRWTARKTYLRFIAPREQSSVE